MAKITITEALAELKVIDKRLEKKKQFVLENLARPEAIKDPMDKDGITQAEAVKRERQAITDLEERKIAIRREIANTNAATNITVSGMVRTIADWLIWRREVAGHRSNFLDRMNNQLQGVRQQALTQGSRLFQADKVGDDVKQTDVLVNISELELASEMEEHDAILETLDGQLSLKNATTKISVE